MTLYRTYLTLHVVHMGLNASETRLTFSCKGEWLGMLSNLSLKLPTQYGMWTITGGHEGPYACKEGARHHTWNTAVITIHTASQSCTMSTDRHHCYTAVHYDWTARKPSACTAVLPTITTSEDGVQATGFIREHSTRISDGTLAVLAGWEWSQYSLVIPRPTALANIRGRTSMVDYWEIRAQGCKDEYVLQCKRN